jgi:ATP-dependent RNA helicase RhlE
VHGGSSYEDQILTLREGVDILIATPGRLLDLYDRKALRLDQVEVFIVDEADRMLDLGFAPDIRKIAPLLPSTRQALFFSATMPKEALLLASSILHKPMQISSDPQSSAAENITKTLYYVEKNNKFALLEWLLKRLDYTRVLVFCRTRRGADRLTERMQKAGLPVNGLHGEKAQYKRTEILESFRLGETPVLIATDLAARGIDKSKHTPDKTKHISKIREQTTWRLSPSQSSKLHTESDGPKKNARRNPKKKKQ